MDDQAFWKVLTQRSEKTGKPSEVLLKETQAFLIHLKRYLPMWYSYLNECVVTKLKELVVDEEQNILSNDTAALLITFVLLLYKTSTIVTNNGLNVQALLNIANQLEDVLKKDAERLIAAGVDLAKTPDDIDVAIAFIDKQISQIGAYLKEVEEQKVSGFAKA